MYPYHLILRILHVGGGVFWAGAVLFLSFYVFPAVVKAGPEGGKISQAIMTTNKMPIVLTIIALVTVISGLLLIWDLSNGFKAEWFTSKYGLALTIGGLTALIAFVQGQLVNRPGALRMQEIGKGIALRGGPPTNEEGAELMKIRGRLILSTQWMAIWLGISIVCMAVAQYL